jgi:hypothetical protein
MPGNPLVRFDEGRGGRTFSVAVSPTLPSLREHTCLATIGGSPRRKVRQYLRTEIGGTR